MCPEEVEDGAWVHQGLFLLEVVPRLEEGLQAEALTLDSQTLMGLGQAIICQVLQTSTEAQTGLQEIMGFQLDLLVTCHALPSWIDWGLASLRTAEN